MFQIISGSPGRMWYPVDNADRSTYATLYIGQIVIASSDGLKRMEKASGAADTTGKQIPFGVVIGTNLKNPVGSSTSNTEYITAVDPHSTTTEFVGGEGPYVRRADKSALAEVAIITPDTILKGDIRNAALSTGPTVGIVTAGDTDGAGFTASTTCDFTPVASLCSLYCRTGANAGVYRITTDTSTTVKTVDHYFPFDIAVGDTFVSVPMRICGSSYVNTDANSLYIDVSQSPATDYFIIDVLELNLTEAGHEYAIFKFNFDHFTKYRQ